MLKVKGVFRMSLKKEIFGWSMYDFANTIFSALFITVYFPLLVTLKGGTAFHVGLVMSTSMLLAAFTVPIFGAVADQTQRKKFLMFIFTIICCLFTFLTGFFGLFLVLICALLANYSFHACLDVYDALLVDISTKDNIGWISGIGTAVGYLGTVLSVGLAYAVGLFYGHETIIGIRVVFILTAVLFFGFSLFTFAFVKESSRIKIKWYHFKQGVKRVLTTIKQIKKFKSLWIFLLSSFLYVDAANTAIIFLFLYARDQIGLTVIQFLPLYVLMALASGVGAIVSGKITDKLGHKKTLTLVLSLWVVVIFGLYLKTTYATFIMTGIFGGALLGAIWTITRPMLIQLAPKDKVAELLGYQGLTEKFGGVIGPFLFGSAAVVFGFKQALFVIIGLFLAGAIVLSYVRKV